MGPKIILKPGGRTNGRGLGGTVRSGLALPTRFLMKFPPLSNIYTRLSEVQREMQTLLSPRLLWCSEKRV